MSTFMASSKLQNLIRINAFIESMQTHVFDTSCERVTYTTAEGIFNNNNNNNNNPNFHMYENVSQKICVKVIFAIAEPKNILML